MPDARRYDTLLAKGEDRKQRILAVAQRLLTRNGWRNTTLAQIAGEAGVTPAGLLHHFESKEQLLHAVLDARDLDDDSHADRAGDLIAQISQVADRFHRAPELLSTFTVLLVENILPDAPLHDRMLAGTSPRPTSSPTCIRRGQADGRYRTDIDPASRQWKFLPSSTEWKPMVARSFDTAGRGVQAVRGDTGAGLRADPTAPDHDMRYRLDVVASSVVDVVRFAGGWLFDRRWPDGTSLSCSLTLPIIPICGHCRSSEPGPSTSNTPWRRSIPVPVRRPWRPRRICSGCDSQVRQGVLQALDHGVTEVTLWGQTWPAELDGSVGLVQHRLSTAAQMFKGQGAGRRRYTGGLDRSHRDLPKRAAGLPFGRGRSGPCQLTVLRRRLDSGSLAVVDDDRGVWKCNTHL